jgi:GH25 family lysozyme M1 (1,4-beta-N-acetylmuramidase)
MQGASVLAGLWLPESVFGRPPKKEGGEIELVDEPTRGEYATYDALNFGPPAERKVKKLFVFPTEVEADRDYGIDISHYTTEVPWKKLRAAKVSYVYIKSSQSNRGRDGKFVKFWSEAKNSGLPYGAYHFLTAGVGGREQGEYFVKRLAEVGGLRKGHLQPVIDLEWDRLGPQFKLVVIGKNKMGENVYKDYWDDLRNKSDVVATVNDCVSALRSGVKSLEIKPIIYTNRQWWDRHIPSGTTFNGCTIWISDYRVDRYANNSPLAVPGHDYYLWQFTDKGRIQVDGKEYGPFDCNKLVLGGIEKITIA